MSLMWSQAMLSMPILLVLSRIIPLETSWLPILLVFGALVYFGDLWFFRVLAHVDVSITNLAWAILSLLLAAAGFLLFNETLHAYQAFGVVLVVGGTVLLSVYHKQLSSKHVLFLVGILALLYLPYYVVKKMAIDAGELPATVFFWMLFARELVAFSVPLVAFPTARHDAMQAIGRSWSFTALNGIVIVSFFLAEYLGALAFDLGSLSLVSITSNVQPFIVIGIAFAIAKFAPKMMPKELLTRQSVTIKLGSFLIVFLGLALLTLS